MIRVGIKDEIKAILKVSQPSTAWMRFYFNVYLYFALLLAVHTVPNIISGVSLVGGWVQDGSYLPIIRFLAQTLTLVSTVITLIQMRNLGESGYWWNIVMLWGNFIDNVAYALMLEFFNLSDMQIPAGVTLIVSAALLAWIIPNLIYFKKRKHLFRVYTVEEVAAAIKGESPTST